MKRSGNLFDQITEWENLRLAAAKALRGKRAKADAREYVADLDSNLKRLRQQLLEDTVPLGRFHQFTIYDPKERLITAPCFEERVLHHAILNVCEPVFESRLIHHTYACRVGKGRIACLQDARRFAARFRFFLKLDVRKYFDSIDHATLKGLLIRRFKDQPLLRLLDRIIDSYRSTPGKGVPIGSLTSQHFANFYLGWFDRFAKEQVRVPGYVRYMDDMALWSNCFDELKATLDASKHFLAVELNLKLKPEPYFNRTQRGMDLLGCRVFPTHHVLNARSRRRFRRKLRALELALTNGQLTELQFQQRSEALVAFTRTPGLKSWRFRRHVIDVVLGNGQGLGSRAPRRELEQQRQELPVGLPQQERAGEPEPQHRVPPGRSSRGRELPQEPAVFPSCQASRAR